jgi:hypothetical protein
VDARPLPVWGFYVRNVKSLTLDHVRLTALSPDMRPVILAENVDQLILKQVKHTPCPPGVEPFELRNVLQFSRDNKG